MHPVARVSIKYWKTSIRNTVFSARFYCALNTVLRTEVFQYLVQRFWKGSLIPFSGKR
jgi:hypothetical protein